MLVTVIIHQLIIATIRHAYLTKVKTCNLKSFSMHTADSSSANGLSITPSNIKGFTHNDEMLLAEDVQ